jgi:hypothetical protein
MSSTFPRGDLTVWQCLYCEQTTTVVVYHDDESHWEAIYAWPRFVPRELPISVPEPIRALFFEGSTSAIVGARRAAAGMYRATVEAIVKNKEMTGGDLKERINSLADAGVDTETVRDLHEARLTGNWSMHEGTEFSSDEVEDVAELIEQACYELYEEPAKREAMRAARQARREGRPSQRQKEATTETDLFDQVMDSGLIGSPQARCPVL